MNDFEAVLIGDDSLGPVGPGDDASVEFHCDAVAFERQVSDNLF